MHAAAAAGHLPCCAALASAGAALDSRDAAGCAALHAAAAADRPEAVALLLSLGASADAADARGRAPLHCAVERGFARCAAALLSGGASVDAADGGGDTPLIVAARCDEPQGRLAVELLARGALPGCANKARAGRGIESGRIVA